MRWTGDYYFLVIKLANDTLDKVRTDTYKSLDSKKEYKDEAKAIVEIHFCSLCRVERSGVGNNMAMAALLK